MKIISVEEDLTYEETLTDVSITADSSNPHVEEYLLDEYGFLHEEKGVKRTDQVGSSIRLYFPSGSMSMIEEAELWNQTQPSLQNFSTAVKSYHEVQKVQERESDGFTNVYASVSGNSSTTGYDITGEMGYTDPETNLNHTEIFTSRCQYSDNGILISLYYKLENSSESLTEIEMFKLDTRKGITSYPFPIFVEVSSATLLGVSFLIFRQRVSTKKKEKGEIRWENVLKVLSVPA